MGEPLLSKPVGGDKVGAVVGFLVLEVAGAAVPLHFQRQVKLRQDVLGCENTEGVAGLSAAGEQGAVVFPLRVRGLGVEEADIVGRICPGFHGVVETWSEFTAASEEVVVLDGRTAKAKPGGAHVLLHEGVVVEAVVGRGVPFLVLYAVVIAVTLPGNEALVVQGVGEERGFKYPGGALPDAVLHALDAVLTLQDGVLAVHEDRKFLLVVVALAFGL